MRTKELEYKDMINLIQVLNSIVLNNNASDKTRNLAEKCLLELLESLE